MEENNVDVVHVEAGEAVEVVADAPVEAHEPEVAETPAEVAPAEVAPEAAPSEAPAEEVSPDAETATEQVA